MMEILAYGEDALTLWALKNKLPALLDALGDHSPPSRCTSFYRPSFGRRGGPRSSQFGEFDFILLADRAIYLGESKWDGSGERVVDGTLHLREEQKLRHRLFAFYVHYWAYGKYPSWDAFSEAAPSILREAGIQKPVAPTGSLLASNLQFVLGTIRHRYAWLPQMRNVLLYLHDGDADNVPKRTASDDFELVTLDYSPALHGRYVDLAN